MTDSQVGGRPSIMWTKRGVVRLGFFVRIDEPRFNKKEYIISLEMAKHLAMMEKTGRAFEVRQYFIDAEKKLRQIAVKAPVRLTPAEMLLQQAQLMLEMERKTSELEEGKHFIIKEVSSVTNHHGRRSNLKSKTTMWTKRGVVRLGFFIKTPMAKEFR